jgi:hypothetical protein
MADLTPLLQVQRKWRHKKTCRPCGMQVLAERNGLQHFARVIGQAGTLAARQGDVAAVRPALEAVDHIGQAARAFGQVRRVDLRDVTETQDLRAENKHRGQVCHSHTTTARTNTGVRSAIRTRPQPKANTGVRSAIRTRPQPRCADIRSPNMVALLSHITRP